MRKLVKTGRFERAFRRFVRRDARLQRRIEETLVLMAEDVYAPSLKLHKLSGKLLGALACSCGYNCRIVFLLENDANAQEVIVLVDIGTHDEVY